LRRDKGSPKTGPEQKSLRGFQKVYKIRVQICALATLDS